MRPVTGVSLVEIAGAEPAIAHIGRTGPRRIRVGPRPPVRSQRGIEPAAPRGKRGRRIHIFTRLLVLFLRGRNIGTGETITLWRSRNRIRDEHAKADYKKRKCPPHQIALLASEVAGAEPPVALVDRAHIWRIRIAIGAAVGSE